MRKWYGSCRGRHANKRANAQEVIAKMDLNGYTVEKEPLYIISKPLDADEGLKNYFGGFVRGMTPVMHSNKKDAYKFLDFEQAKSVAFLICGNVVEDEI